VLASVEKLDLGRAVGAVTVDLTFSEQALSDGHVFGVHHIFMPADK